MTDDDTHSCPLHRSTRRALTLVLLAMSGEEQTFESLASYELEGTTDEERIQALLSAAWIAGGPSARWTRSSARASTGSHAPTPRR
jgi:alkylhydroperoxidase/carboxymuconolactone decarboxylase family protein YurZ